MNFNSYKVFDKVSGYYFYTVSHIDDPEFIIDIVESYADANPQDPINEYFSLVSGWNNVDAEKATITPNDVINKQFQPDPKNMAISEDYKKLTAKAIEALNNKKARGGKKKVVANGDAAQPKPPPKPRGKKSVGTAPEVKQQ